MRTFCYAGSFAILVIVGSAYLLYGALRISPAEASMERLRECVVDPAAVLSCGREEVQVLYQNRDARDVMSLLSEHLTQGQCHTIGHLVGQETLKRTGDLETAIDQCSYACTGACVHGAIGQAIIDELGGVGEEIDPEHLSEEQVQGIAERLCRTRGMCHGVGHILFQIYNEFDEPLRICDDSSRGGTREHCYRGVFMEHADTVSTHNLLLGTERIQLRDPDDLLYPCNAVAESYQHACFRYLPRIQRDTLAAEEERLSFGEENTVRKNACESLGSPDARSACFEGYGFFYFDSVRTHADTALKLCGDLSQAADRAACVLGITYPVADNGDTGLVKGFCERVEGESERSVCYHGLFEAERYREDLRPTPEDLAHLCKAGDTQCEAELNRYVMDPWDTVFGVQLSQL